MLGLCPPSRGVSWPVHANELLLPDAESDLRDHEPDHVVLQRQIRLPLEASGEPRDSLLGTDHHPIHSSSIYAVQEERDVPRNLDSRCRPVRNDKWRE